MGCYPLGKMVSKAFGKCSGKERRRSSRDFKLSPPPSYRYSCPRTVVRTVNFSNETPIVIIPPDPNPPVTSSKPRPMETNTHHPISTTSTVAAATATATPANPETIVELPHPHPHVVSSPPTGTVHKEPTPVQRGPPHCYVMSPLPRWEERPRRRDYFSGEYYYYPTPIREGIYNMAADPNRLTTIFSEENPNACTIA